MSDPTPADPSLTSPTSPPPRPPQRKNSNYLLLGVNVLILLFAVYIVWSRMKGGGGTGEEGVTDANAAVTDATDPRRGDTGWSPGAADGGSTLTDVRPRGGGDGGGPRVRPEGHIRDYRPRGDNGAGDTADGAGGGRLADDVAWTDRVDYDDSTMRSLAGTERAIDGIGVNLEVYNALHNEYPSSAVDFGANRGIEALYAALDEAGRLGSEIAGDTDGDGRPELLDGWGRPLVYASPDDYANSQDWVDGAGESFTITAARSRARDMFQAPSRFQLWSAGPDGRNDGGLRDDITSWLIRD